MSHIDPILFILAVAIGTAAVAYIVSVVWAALTARHARRTARRYTNRARR